MTAFREVTINCDGHQHWEQFDHENIKEARKELKRYGWTFVTAGSRDYCAACSAALLPAVSHEPGEQK